MSVTLEDARKISQKLKQDSPHVRAVLLFGSTLKKGVGRDADFVVVASENVVHEWWRLEGGLIRVRWPDAFYEQRWIVKKFFPFLYGATTKKRRLNRLVTAGRLLGLDLASFVDARGNRYDFELFLCPEDWRTGTIFNANALRPYTNLVEERNTRGFFERIANEARDI